MSTALTMPKLNDAIEAALIHGDLSKLDPAGRLSYYKAVCESIGLNPLTRPFEYITLNGKLTLYAKRDCAEQLRKIHGVAIISMVPQQIGDLLVVTVTAEDKTGRSDSSTGAVFIKGLTGENLANAMMKAETKAKRRVTLSLCGLGLLDETEVESIADARSYSEPQKAATFQEQVKASLALISPPEGQSGSVESAFKVEGNQVTAKVVDVVPGRSKKGTDYLLVKIDGAVEGSGSLFCYHGSLASCLKTAKDQVCLLEWVKKGEWLYVEDVLAIGSVDYRDGKPVEENLDSEPS